MAWTDTVIKFLSCGDGEYYCFKHRVYFVKQGYSIDLSQSCPICSGRFFMHVSFVEKGRRKVIKI